MPPYTTAPKQSTSDQLTKSGLLYEGNFETWHEQTVCILDIRGLPYGFINSITRLISYPNTERLQAAILIMSRISPGLEKRIPATARDDPASLLSCLRALAKPFRLNDMPPEIRARIYHLHFKQAGRYSVSSATSPRVSHESPALLLVSRAIRSEALSVFYRSSEFEFAFVSRGVKGRISTAVRNWAKNYVKQGARDLRCLCVRAHWAEPFVEVTLDMKKGLVVIFKGGDRWPAWGFTSEQKRDWRKHIEQVEADRQALGLLGEALILAFTSKPELWERAG
ncbi:hypothetical protein LTR17_020444 [Elasticomyces elasticus]|nr:hypothetical protein LTR17_020444 [Elasticomyces elasticus]